MGCQWVASGLHTMTWTGDCPWRIGVPDAQYASGLVAVRGGLVSRRSIRERIGGCAWRIGLPDAQYASGLVAARSRLLQGARAARAPRARERIGGCAWRIGAPDAQYASGLVAARGCAWRVAPFLLT